jgi:hypothetical protein
LAGAVQRLGVQFCDDLVPGSARFNPKGHFECRQWKAVGVRIQNRGVVTSADMREYGRLVSEHLATPEGVWGLKDPYLSWTLSDDVIDLFGPDTRVIAIHRAFHSVVKSRIPHSGLSRYEAEQHQLQQASALYLHLACLEQPVLHVAYEELVADPVFEMERVAGFIYGGRGDAPDAAVIEKAAAFIDPSLNHYA